MTALDTVATRPDRPHPRLRYALTTEPIDNGPGVTNSVHVTVVERRVCNPVDGPAERVVGSYVRTLSSVGNTFYPFRQLRDGMWRDYALISAAYTSVSVMDLDTGAIVATEQPTQAALDAAQKLIASSDRYAGARPEDVAAAWGFCPVEFHVIDWWDDAETAQQRSADPAGTDVLDRMAAQGGISQVAGEFAVYAGCHWGDDTSWKLRFIDLSRLSEGIITCDDRFGYVEIPYGLPLEKCVTYWPEENSLEVAVNVSFSLNTGRANPATRDDIAWDDPAASLPTA